MLSGIVGDRADPDIADRLHRIEHVGRVEILSVAPADMARKRLRGVTDAGTECAIAIPREASLVDGAVLLLESRRAIIVRSKDQRWLRLRPMSPAAALELGYHAGNLHWRVRFDGADLLVAIEVPVARYLARIATLTDRGLVVAGDLAGETLRSDASSADAAA